MNMQHSSRQKLTVDLESAFNDGYQLSPQPLFELVVQWTVAGSLVIALASGGGLLARSLFLSLYAGCQLLGSALSLFLAR